MSEAFDRGRDTEREVAALLRKKLKIHVQRDSRSGAGTSKADIRDYYNELPIFIECKDQETLKVKEWMRQTIDGASFNQVPTLVFRMDTDLMACMPFVNVVDFLLEIADLRAEVADLRLPITNFVSPRMKDLSKKRINLDGLPEKVELKAERGANMCRNGHIADEYGYCMQLDCKFSRGYKPRKVKK